MKEFILKILNWFKRKKSMDDNPLKIWTWCGNIKCCERHDHYFNVETKEWTCEHCNCPNQDLIGFNSEGVNEQKTTNIELPDIG